MESTCSAGLAIFGISVGRVQPRHSRTGTTIQVLKSIELQVALEGQSGFGKDSPLRNSE